MKAISRILAVLVALMVILSACVYAEETEWEYQEDTSEFDLTYWCASFWGGQDLCDENLHELPQFKCITDYTGAVISIDAPNGSEGDVAGVMIASGTYPDMVVFSSFNSPYLKMMYEAGQLLCIEDLINEYCPKMWTLLPEWDKSAHKQEDGKLWTLTINAYSPTWGEEAVAMGSPYVELPHGWNIMTARKDIYEAFGKEIEDIDTFTEYLYFVKENYPDAIPFMAPNNGSPRSNPFQHLRGTFGICQGDFYPLEDGTVKHYMYDPGYVEYLRWLNKLYNDGIFTQNDLIADSTTLDSRTENNVYGASLNALWNMYGALEDVETSEYELVGPIKGKDGTWACVAMFSYDGYTIALTDNCANPERVIKMLEYTQTEEGQLNLMAGPRGRDWEYAEDGSFYFTENAMYDQDNEYNESRSLLVPMIKAGTWEGIYNGVHDAGDGYAQVIGELTDKFLNQYCTELLTTGYNELPSCIVGGSDLDVLRTRIDEVCTVAAEKMIVAADEAAFDALYSDCLLEIEKMGVAQIEEAYTAEHQAQCAALGIEP